MRYWWVNQNQTYRHEVPGGYLWSPVKKENGHKNHFYDTMTEVRPGDTVFSFVGSRIVAVGLALTAAEPSPKPDFGAVGVNWADAGWLVQVEFQTLEHTIRPKDHISTLGPHLPTKYSPLTASGNGLQHVYLAEISAPFAGSRPTAWCNSRPS